MKINRLAPMLVGLLVVLVVTSWSGVFLAYAENPSPVSVLVELNASDLASMRAAIARVEAHGGFCTHRFPFRGCVGRLPAGEDKFLLAEPEIAGVYRGTVSREELALLDQNLEMALVVWEKTFVDPTPAVSLLETDPPPPFHDALVPPGRPTGEEMSGVSGAGLSSTSPGYYETSEFMIGSVVVGIVMPESDGGIDSDQENWSMTRQNEVITEISAALDWWAAREAAAGLSFTYQVERGVPTGYEPITRPQSDEGLWISDVMGQLGYGSGDDLWTRVRDYVNALRTEYETDWAFVAFVVDDLIDTDNFFAPNPSGTKYFAYAYLGGPFMVMTYGNDGYGPTNMDVVMSHEMGHIFLALDAYTGSDDCHVYGGYLDVENSNSLNPAPGTCGMDQPCIMRGQVAPYAEEAVSPQARGQIGWRDSDDDRVLDPVDTDVGLSVWSSRSQSSPEGVSRAFSGVAFDLPWDSLQRSDVTINTVASVEYRVDGGVWQPASADDGAWDEALEEFTFETGALSADVYTVTVQAHNSVGNTFSYDMEMSQTEGHNVYLPHVMK